MISLRRPSCVVSSVLACAALLLSTSWAKDGPPEVRIAGTPAGGVVARGETVHWTITAPPGSSTGLHFRLRKNNAAVLQEGDLSAGTTAAVTAKLGEPGWLYLDVTQAGGAPVPVASAGVLVAPEAIKPAAPRPDDFDAFWKAQVDQIRAIPANPQIKRIDSEKPGVQLFEITLDGIDGHHVHAQLARPEAGERFPAIAVFQYAGVYPLQKTWATNYAAKGWLVLNVLAHDLPLYAPKAYYDGLADLRAYPAIGDQSRETSYFRRMLLGDDQAVEYLSHRPDWDGRVLLVRGESQGGLQSFAMAGLNPKVTAMVVSVPAGADTMAKQAGRAEGWPGWDRMGPPEASAAIMKTSQYYDPANFAATVHCPALVTVGLRDTTATSPSVMSAFNAIPGPKELVVMPDATHTGNHQASAARVDTWFGSILRTGSPPTEHLSSAR